MSKRAADSDGPAPKRVKHEDDDGAVEFFKRFLEIPTVSYEGVSSGSYDAAVHLLEAKAKSIGLETKIISPVEGKPVLIATLTGKDVSLPSVLLNSHYDVVPAVRESWTSDPFVVREDDDGNIFARGTQDMKCVCIQHLEAMGRLVKSGASFSRTVHLTFVPDEEIGGVDGMGEFIKTPEFKELNIAVALDEGLANPANAYTVFYGERAIWWVKLMAEGGTGHASRFIEDTAVPKLLRVLNKVTAFRDEQESLLKGGGCAHAKAKKLGDVQSINITMLDAGIPSIGPDGAKRFPYNVVPIVAQAGFDTRIPPTTTLESFKEKVDEWTAEEGVSWEFACHTPAHGVTSIERAQNPWWSILEDTLKEENIPLEPEIFPAATDSRYLRQLGFPAFGFSPMRNTPILLHDHNEFLNRSVFVEGIRVFEKLIPRFANAGEDVHWHAAV